MNFIIEKATETQYDSIINLIRTVYNSMEQTDWFAADNDEYTREMLSSGKGTAFIAIEEKTAALAAVFMVTYPGHSVENLGLDIDLPADTLHLVAHMDSAAVLPVYRGHHLQKRLMEHAESHLCSKGYRYLCCTIHPDNKYSLNSALALGYKVKTTCEKYGGYMRAVLMKELPYNVIPSVD